MNVPVPTRAGRLDVMTRAAGAAPCGDLAARAERRQIDGASMLIASADDVVLMKRAAGRTIDAADIAAISARRPG